MLPSPAAMLGVWAAGGALAFAGALAYAELATRRPQAGGEYVLSARELRRPRRVSDRLDVVRRRVRGRDRGRRRRRDRVSRSVPAGRRQRRRDRRMARRSADADDLRPLARRDGVHRRARARARPRPRSGPLDAERADARQGRPRWRCSSIAGFLVARPEAPPAARRAAAPVAWQMWLLALVPVMFSYSGWNAAVYVAEEIRDPERNVPRALALGTATVAVLYLALNALYLRVLPHDALVGAISVGALAADRLFGSAAGGVFAALAIVIVLGSVSAMTLAGPRVYFAMARDAAFFRSAARVHPRYHTPAVAILAQAGMELPARAVGNVRRSADLHRVRGHSLLVARRALAVRRPPAGGGRCVSRVGLSVGARGLLPGRLRDRRQHRARRRRASRSPGSASWPRGFRCTRGRGGGRGKQHRQRDECERAVARGKQRETTMANVGTRSRGRTPARRRP